VTEGFVTGFVIGLAVALPVTMLTVLTVAIWLRSIAI
jgi:hypothetical protein